MSIPPLGPIAAASTWGAEHGPRIIRQINDSGRTWRAALMMVGSAVFGLLLTAVWIVLMVMGVPLLSLVLGVAATSAWFAVAEGAARWWWHPRSDSGPVLTDAPSGTPALAWRRSRASMVRPVGLVVLLLACAVGEVVAAAAGGHRWGYVAPALLVAIVVWLAVPFLRGRVTAGGLYLTPTGIEHVWGAAVASVSWADAALLPDHGPFGLRRTPGTRHDRRGWHIQDPVDHVRRPDVTIPLAYLTSPARMVRPLVEEYLHHRALRPELGTPASLDRARHRSHVDGTGS
ncbi:hypothetical protein ACHAAC_09325 [Aeromicrobium sp. CF4.19]|uniref:hypothetical protein n=1 Tax=Aeromicrobium sp. CF4.19 TaxID=3373082 RepID=UPI003EE7AA1E